jgi:hypothetical protein
MKKIFNIISKENNAQIVHCTSNKNEYPVTNILLDDLNVFIYIIKFKHLA